MSKILTAEEFFKLKYWEEVPGYEVMIEFAKLHVEEALKQAAKEVKTYNVYNESTGDIECKVTLIDKDSILNAYPLDKIK